MAAYQPVGGAGDWLVGNPGRAELAAALWMGSVGLLILGLQPLLLGALFTEGKVSADGLALVATAEIIAIGVGSALVATLLSSNHMRLKSSALLVLLAIANIATAYNETLGPMIAIRAVAGLLEGGLVAVATELVARSRRAERIGGFFVTLQTLAQCALALILALWVIPAKGAAGGFVTLGVVCIASLAAAVRVPSRYEDLPRDENFGGALRLRPAIALLCIFSFFMFIGAIWAFLEPLGGQFGVDAQTVGLIVSASLAVQVMGALAATWLEARIDYRAAISVIGLIGVGCALALASGPGLTLFWIVALVIGFIWLFVIPYQIRLAITADETRGTALLVPAAQLLGSAIGPVGASLLIDGANFRPVAEFAAVSAVASVVLLGLFVAAGRRAAVA